MEKVIVNFCSGVHEHDMDLMFMEEFCSSEVFTALFMDKIGVKDFAVTKVIHSQYEEGNGIDVATQARMMRQEDAEADSRGESDITVIYSHDGKTKALLVEDKINAGQQPGQRERYDARGRKAVADGVYDSFDVFLVAPAAYCANEYENKVTYEEIRQYFEAIGDGRSLYKVALIDKAIEKKQSHSAIIVPSEKVMDFYDGYVRYQKDNHSDLYLMTQAGQDRGSKSNWFKYSTGMGKVELIHQTLRKVVSIQINYGKDDSGIKARKLRQWLEGVLGNLGSLGLSFNPNKSSVSLKYNVPMLNTGESIYDQIDDADTCFEAIDVMADIVEKLRAAGIERVIMSL